MASVFSLPRLVVEIQPSTCQCSLLIFQVSLFPYFTPLILTQGVITIALHRRQRPSPPSRPRLIDSNIVCSPVDGRQLQFNIKEVGMATLRNDVRFMLVVIVLSILVCSPARGHTTRGHNVIEAAAYKNLLKKQRGDIPHLPSMSGKEVIDLLVAQRILRVPPCYPQPDGNPDCNMTETDSLGWLPVIGSGDMDAIFYRQFSKNGQYFHFMASPGALYRNPEIDPRTNAPRGLTEEAYPLAIRFLTGMYFEILERSDESKKYYRDLYSLIHTVGDSFSEAHADRDTVTWAIKLLKPWQATAWEPFLIYWSGWPYYFSDLIHWFPEDPRDKMYYREDLVPADEVEFYEKSPYLLPRLFLNARGIEAADAIEDLLVITAIVLKEGGDNKDSLERAATREWRWYLDQHFKGYSDPDLVSTVEFKAAPREEQEWRPMVQVGVTGRTRKTPGGQDLLVAMNFAKPPSVVDPFGFYAGYEIGRRSGAGSTLWVGSVSFGLYLWHYSDLLALGLDPTVADLTWDGNRLTVEPMFSFARFDAWISRRVWVSVQGFRYSLINGFRSREFSLTLGVAFSRDIPLHWTDWFTPRRYLDKAEQPVGERWRIPDVDSPLRLNPRAYGYFHPFGYGFHSRPSHISILPVGYTFLRDIDRRSKFSRWSYGMYVGAGGEHKGHEVWMFVKAGPVMRFRLLSLLSLQAAPLTPRPAIGLSKHAKGYVDADASATIVLALGSIELDLDVLKYSFREKHLEKKAIAELKVGILRE